MFDFEQSWKVVISTENHYSIWPTSRETPVGWSHEGFVGSKQDCLNHIEKVWEDLSQVATISYDEGCSDHPVVKRSQEK